jgi:hypothetical protein
VVIKKYIHFCQFGPKSHLSCKFHEKIQKKVVRALMG